MKFNLGVTAFYYTNENEVKELEGLGFKFEKSGGGYYIRSHMINKDVFIEINSLEELMDFVKKHGRIIVDDDVAIEIYNDYRE